jgi:hypothetical protein
LTQQQSRSVRPTRTRFSTRGPKGQRGTVIRFRLRRGGRVELVVRANSAPCTVVGRKRVRGHEGLNRVPFDGRIHGRPLAAGKYTITVVVVRAGERVPVGTIAVEVVPSGRRLTPAQQRAPVAAAGCFATSTSFSSGMSVLAAFAAPLAGGGNAVASDAKAHPTTTPPPASLGPSLRPPTLPVTDGEGLSAGWAGLLLYIAIGIAGTVMLIQVARFLRGSWNP